MSCYRILALGALVVATSANAQILYTEDFDDGMADQRWSAPIVVVEEPQFSVPDDSSTIYNFDYSQVANPGDAGNPIPSAPNTTNGSTVGVFMQTNLSSQCGAGNPLGCANEGESVGIVSDYDLPSGNFKVTADLFLFWNRAGGSTEYATFGVLHSRSANVPFRFNINNGDGLAWQGDTDGDSGTDVLAYSSVDGETGLGGWEDIAEGSIPGVPTGPNFPSQGTGLQNQWVELEIAVANGIATWFINGTPISSQDASPFTSGGILLGQSDPFNSVNPVNSTGFANGAIFDNIVVMVIPEPTTGVLAAFGLAGAFIRRRS